MKAMLRRAHLRIDVTTAQGERRAVQLSARPGEPGFSGLLARLVLVTLAENGLQLVDEQEQPFDAADTLPPSLVPDALTAPASVVRPGSPPIPPAPVAATPSAAPASGELSPAIKRPRVFGNAAAQPATVVVPALKHVVSDAHRRIEPTRNAQADVVIGPRDVQPIGGAQRVNSAVVVSQSQAQPAVVIQPNGVAQQVVPPVLPEPDHAAPVIKRRRVEP